MVGFVISGCRVKIHQLVVGFRIFRVRIQCRSRMGVWRTPSAFALVPKLLLVPMIVLGWNHVSPATAGKSLASSDAAATCAEELMALFSGPARAGNVTAARAEELRSCIRPLVPYHEIVPSDCASTRRRSLQGSSRTQQFSTVDELMEVNAMLLSGKGLDEDDDREKVERLVQWPPGQILSLARRATVFGGDPSAVLSELSPIRYPVHSLTFSFPFF